MEEMFLVYINSLNGGNQVSEFKNSFSRLTHHGISIVIQKTTENQYLISHGGFQWQSK
jgi:hypothetical protein